MELKQIELNKIRPNPYQPRERFDKQELQDLADNIKTHNLIEPIVITPKGNSYVIVAGERRYRASKLAGLNKIYAIIKEYETEADIKRDSLIENELRENLSYTEFKEFAISLAKSLGKPYWEDGKLNPMKLAGYILGKENQLDSRVHNSTIRVKLNNIVEIEQRGSAKLKRAIDDERIDFKTAARISGITDKQIQDDLVDMAKHKTTKEIRQQVQRHNIKERVKVQKQKLKNIDDENKKKIYETDIINKYAFRINGFLDNLALFLGEISERKKIINSLSDKSRLDMLDTTKRLYKNISDAKERIEKFMEELAK